MKVGFVGLGAMGSRMAGRLAGADHKVSVWNRTAGPAEAFAARGVRVTASPAEAAEDADVVMSMVTDDAAAEAVTLGPDGILAGLKSGAVHASASTISIDLARRLAAAHAERGQVLLSTTVLGRPPAAESGTLFVIAAGSEDKIAHVRPVLEAVGQRIFVVGAEPWQANLVKLCANFMIFSTIEQLGEVFALGAKADVPDETMFDVLRNSLFGAPVHINYGSLIVGRRFSPPGARMAIGKKDNDLILEAGASLGASLPLASLIRDRFISAIACGNGELDFAALSQGARRDAGLD